MAHKDQRQKWIDAVAAFSGGRKVRCPNCGGGNFNHGYIELNKEEHIGWGAVWCEDCRNAFVLSRVLLETDETRKKIVSSLPVDLKFV